MATETINETTTKVSTILSDLLYEEEPHTVPSISTKQALKADATSITLLEDDYYEYELTSMIQAKSMVVPTLESHYTDPQALKALEEGGCLFTFVCNHQLTPYQAEMVNRVVNLSAFDDETVENFVPHYEYNLCEEEEEQYTLLLARAAYLLVGVDLQQLVSNPSFLSTLEYQRACQPGGTTIWQDYDQMEPNNFRITKPIIPYLYNFTIQFQVSKITSSEVLEKLARHVGIRVDGAILLERTKRSVPPSEDATKKCKSVLLYTSLDDDGVVLVTHLTVIVQQGLPEIVERAIGTFGQWGLGETCETAWRTRRFLKQVMPVKMSGEEENTVEGEVEEEEGENFFDAVGGEDPASDADSKASTSDPVFQDTNDE